MLFDAYGVLGTVYQSPTDMVRENGPKISTILEYVFRFASSYPDISLFRAAFCNDIQYLLSTSTAYQSEHRAFDGET